MRIAVLILGILGGLASGFLGYRWYSDSQSPDVKMMRELLGSMANDPSAKDDPKMKETKTALAEFDGLVRASYILLAGLLAGIAGGVLALMRKGMIAGLLMLAFGILPGVFAPKALVFTSILILAGALAFLVKPAPAGA